jgi:hypothetical protein
MMFSFVVTMLVATTGYGLYVLWDSYDSADHTVRQKTQITQKVREWSTLMEWSATINTSLITSDLDPRAVQYFFSLNAPAIERITTLRREIGEADETPYGQNILEQIDEARDKWLASLKTAITYRIVGISNGDQSSSEIKQSKEQINVAIVRDVQVYINLLNEYQRHAEVMQMNSVRSIASKLVIVLISISMLGILVASIVAGHISKLVEQAERNRRTIQRFKNTAAKEDSRFVFEETDQAPL